MGELSIHSDWIVGFFSHHLSLLFLHDTHNIAVGFVSPRVSSHLHRVGVVVCYSFVARRRFLFWSPPELVDSRHDVFLLLPVAAEIFVPVETVYNAGPAPAVHLRGHLHGGLDGHCVPSRRGRGQALRLLRGPNLWDGQSLLLVFFVLFESLQEEATNDEDKFGIGSPRTIVGIIGQQRFFQWRIQRGSQKGIMIIVGNDASIYVSRCSTSFFWQFGIPKCILIRTNCTYCSLLLPLLLQGIAKILQTLYHFL